MAERDDTVAAVSHPRESWLASSVRALRRLVWPTVSAHLSDDQVMALAVDAAGGRPTDATLAQHLASCRRCDRRSRDATAQLQALADVATTGFDETFTPGALHAQRTRIGRRLDRLVGTAAPGRLLDFPFSRSPRRRVPVNPGGWLPAAVVGALLFGLTAGQFVHLHPVDAGANATTPAVEGRDAAQTASDVSSDRPRTASGSARTRIGAARNMDMTGTVQLPPLPGEYTGPLTLDAFAQVMPDEAFFGSLDVTLTSTQVSELASIDALTPRVRDLAINIR
jgi:hypothetical protein